MIGTRDGAAVRRVYDASHALDWGQQATGRVTGVCAAVGAQLLGRHGRTSPGFVDPEVYYDPTEFLEELGKRGTVSVTWADTQLEGAALERAATATD